MSNRSFEMRPIIFLSGRSFINPVSGLSRRTKLMFEALTHIFSGPKYLLVPIATKDEANCYAQMGWTVIGLPAEKNDLRTKAKRFFTALQSKLNDDRSGELLRLRGGSMFIQENLLRDILLKHHNALVWVYRADYWNLIRHRLPGQFWVMDANDSIWRLQMAYGWSVITGRLIWPRPGSLAELLKRSEARWIGRYDLILAISQADYEYFAKSANGRIVLMDTCVTAPQPSGLAGRAFAAGFLGSDHAGAVDSARALLQLARDGKLGSLGLVIAGGCARFFPTEDQRWVSTEPVADASRFWADFRYAVFPLVQPTGISVKFQEAVAAGCVAICRRGAGEWSKATAGLHYHEYDRQEEIVPLIRQVEAARLQPDYRGMSQANFESELHALLAAEGAL